MPYSSQYLKKYRVNRIISKMKAIIIIIIYYCMALLPPIIYGVHSGDSSISSNMNFASDHGSPISDYSNDGSTCSTATSQTYNAPLEEIRDNVEDIIKNKGTINKVFIPLKHLKKGKHSQIYEGHLKMKSGKLLPVAMKISPFVCRSSANIPSELDIYRRLEAVGNSLTEKYGIPNVYYHGEWNECTLLAITLLDPEFTLNMNKKLLDTPLIETDENYKSLEYYHICLEFILALKYMHSHGVCHHHIDKNDLMFRSNRGFIVDFGTSYLVSQGPRGVDCRKTNLSDLMYSLKYLWSAASIGRLENEALRTIFTLFEQNIDPDVKIDYNGMYRAFAAKIQGLEHNGPFIFSWMNEQQRKEITDRSASLWEQYQHPEIEKIANPYR